MNKLLLDHITINVNNMEESIKFYQDILNLEILNSVDMGDHLIQYFDLGGDARLELIKYNFNTNESKSAAEDRGIYRHLALVTEDVYSIYERVIQKNIYVKNEPSFQKKLGFINFLMIDPNGVEIEIIEY